MSSAPTSPQPGTDPETGPPRYLAWSVRYTDHVADVCCTPRGRADLTTGLTRNGLSEPWLMLPHLQARMPRASHLKIAYLAVAAMYADQAPNPTASTQSPPTTYDPGHGNFGWSLARAKRAGVLQEDHCTTLLQRLARIRKLDAFLKQLQPEVSRLANKNVPISWPHLLRDLTRWPQYRTSVTDEWMTSLYMPSKIDDELQGFSA
ncbi:type I-E CRISPR-associated protein Cse2/CasB [Streptomyces noursei]|uniref:type I-E CRISPR-associated protein Cse2/CasB n=1 Tax=Streptomyces noursei TaxID=1971 RepID=UPI00344B0F53